MATSRWAPSVVSLLGLMMVTDDVRAQDPPQTQRLQERIRALEERLG